MEWTKTYQDMVGRDYVMTYNEPTNNYPRHESFYNTKGQLIRQEDPDGVTTMYDYNDIGERTISAIDINSNDAIDYSGTDQITMTTRNPYLAGTGGNPLGKDAMRFRTLVYDQNNTSSLKTLKDVWQSTDGLKSMTRIYKDQSTLVDTVTEKNYISGPNGITGYKVTTTYPDGTKSEHILF